VTTTVTEQDNASTRAAEPEAAPVSPAPVRRRSLPPWLRADGPAWTWAGMVLAGLGFVLIGIAWGQVAGETQVYLQLPYVVSAGLTGLGLIMVGVTVVNVAAKRRDEAARERQTDRLVSILADVEDALAAPKRRRR
jgi:hypothetical protein